MKLFTGAIPYLLLAVLSAFHEAYSADTFAIRDIHGAIAPYSLPPFALTAIVLPVAGLLVYLSFYRKQPYPLLPAQPVEGTPEALLHDYEKGTITVMRLFENVSATLRHHLTENNDPALTSLEIVNNIGDGLPSDTAATAAALLILCDRVRYGAHLPAKADVRKALGDVRSILDVLAETGAKG